MVGASTKFNNYLYANIPFLVNKNRNFVAFRKHWKFYNIVNLSNPKNISNSINTLSVNKKLYGNLKKNGKEFFNKSMNFEYQFNKFFGCINQL
jgi:hypothetical protein